MRRVKCGSMQREGASWKVLMRNRLKTNSEWPQSGPVTPLSFNEVVKHQKRQCGIHAVCTDLWCAPDKQGGTASDIGHHTIWVQKDPGCTIEVTRPCNSILDCRGRFFDLQEIVFCKATIREDAYLISAIRRHQLGSKGILPPMIHGLLRISCSRNPKTPQIRSFFYEKWLLFGVLRVNKSCFFMQAWNA